MNLVLVKVLIKLIKTGRMYDIGFQYQTKNDESEYTA